MHLTLQQTATTLGKSVRQVRYLIQQGRLPAQKVGGRWVVESSALEGAAPGMAERAQRRTGQLRAAIDEALTPKESGRPYSLRDLKAFQLSEPLYRCLCQELGSGHAAATHLKTALEHLAQGCHRYGREEKTAAYRAARDAASLAVLELLLDAGGPHEALVSSVEGDLMPALAGLLRRTERRRGDWQ